MSAATILAERTAETRLSQRTKPPFRADHVGSLLRPRSLLDARAKFQAGEISEDELKTVQRDQIRTAVEMQESIGLQAVTDGEYNRTTWHMDFLYRIGGVEKVYDDSIKVTFHSESGDTEWTPAGLRVVEKLRLDHCIFGDDFLYLKSLVKDGTPKLTIPSPSMIHYRGGRSSIDQSVYPTLDEFWDDLGAVYAKEIAQLWELGCTYLQLDDTSLAYLNDPEQRRFVEAQGGCGHDQHRTYIRLMNAALKDRPAGMTVTTHLCRGNFRSSWVASGSYEHVADALFNELDVDGYFLEFDDERSGGFEPLRFVPKGKLVVLGLVTTKRGVLESKDFLKRRLDEAAEFIDLDQVCLSPQCGFSSTVDGNALTWEEQSAKLRLVVEVAEEVWG